MSPQIVSPVFAGRHEESARLAGAFTLAAEGDPATVLIGGEAGCGKSRLVTEFTRDRDSPAADARVLLGGCAELGLPFAPFVAALRALAGDLTDAERDGLAPLLPGHTAGPASHDDARIRLFETLLTALARLSAGRPTVLVVEDAHWADRSSRDLLDFLIRNQRAAPGSLIVVTHRSDELGRAHPLRPLLAELTRLPWVERIELRRLAKRHVVRQIGGILGRVPDPDVADAVFRRSEGNPLFVEALLDNEHGADVPSPLEDLLLARVERLPAGSRELLRVAAVAGARVRHALLAAVYDGDPTAGLRAAVDAGVLLIDGDDYVFRHALIRDAVYSHLLPGERVALHARYAEALRTLPRVQGELAFHLSAAGDTAGALSAAWEASLQARRALAYAEELGLLEQVLELWGAVPCAAERIGRDHAGVLEHAAMAASRAGEHRRGERHAGAALAELDRRHERVRCALLLEQRAQMRAQLGHGGALDDFHEAARLVPTGHHARGYVLNSLAEHLSQVPMPDEARRVAEQALRHAHDSGDDPTEAAALITLAMLDARVGELDRELPKFAKARAMAENIRAHRVRLRALHVESSLLQAFGRLSEAQDVARLGLAAAHETGLTRSAGTVHAIDLVGAQVSAGRWDEATESIEHALDVTQPGTDHTNLLCFRGYLFLYRGEVGEAERIVDHAHRQLDSGTSLPQDRLLLPRLEADLRLAQGRLREATDVVYEALEFPQLMVSSRLTWPLLVIGARVARAGGDLRLLDRLRAHAASTRVAGPVQRAASVTFDAEVTTAEGEPEPAFWEASVAAWEELAQPLRHAQALLGLGEALLATGDARDQVAAALRTAAGLADGLGARPLRDAIGDVARRARVPLSGAAGAAPSRAGLTAREQDILWLVADGLSNRQIAERLFIAAKTASVHVSNILGKLGVSNRVEASAAARRLGLLP